MQQRFHPLIVSLLLHIVLLVMLIVNIEFSSPPPVLENANSKIINAVVLDAATIQRPDPAPLPPKPKPMPIKKVVPVVEKTPPPVKKVETKPVPKVVQQRDAVAIPDKRKKIQKELLEKQLLSELEQAKKQKKQKHKELEKSFAKELKAQAAKTLEQQLLNEQNRLASAAQAQKMQGVVDKYKALILQSIAQHWLVPNGIDKSLTAHLLIRVAPGGAVLDVQIVKTSGDEALDRSARIAVFKASPLPVPAEPDEFDPFRQFILKVKPENLIARDADLT